MYCENLLCEGRPLELNFADGNLAQFVQPIGPGKLVCSFLHGVPFLNCWPEID